MSLEILTRETMTDADWTAYKYLLAGAFNFPADVEYKYFDRVGRENITVARIDGHIAGGMAAFPTGIYFGGRAIPMSGISIVATAPEFRSQRVATQMLQASLREQHARALPLSGLYPATVPVYRTVGYELAGMQFEITLQCREIDVRERTLNLRRERDGDAEIFRAHYERWAPQHAGNLVRTKFLWDRVRERHMLPVTTGYVVERAGAAEGYVFCALAKNDAGDNYVRVTDLVASTPAAGRRILAFLADHRSMAETVTVIGSPNESWLMLLREQPYEVTRSMGWMLRIVHVPAALTQRGYPNGCRGEVHFDVRDDLLTENNGRFTLVVEDGVGRVSAGGRGSVVIDVRGLAALYSGFHAPGQLAATDYLTAPAGELETLTTLFAGPLPWMRDPF